MFKLIPDLTMYLEIKTTTLKNGNTLCHSPTGYGTRCFINTCKPIRVLLMYRRTVVISTTSNVVYSNDHFRQCWRVRQVCPRLWGLT